MCWFYLILAILLEVVGTTFMKLSHGFTRLVPSILMFILYGLSLIALTFAVKKIDISVAYIVWSGVGSAFIATVGILWFNETVNALKIVSIGLIIIGVIGLNYSKGIH